MMNGKRLKELRRAQNIGQVELAKRVGISQGSISQLEVGVRDCLPDTLEALARELKVSVEELAGEPTEMIRLVRNLKGLSPKQITIINDLVLQIKK